MSRTGMRPQGECGDGSIPSAQADQFSARLQRGLLHIHAVVDASSVKLHSALNSMEAFTVAERQLSGGRLTLREIP